MLDARLRTLPLAIAGLALLCAAPVCADVAVTSKVQTTREFSSRGPDGPSIPRESYWNMTTVYYKGADVRIEVTGGPAFVFRSALKKAYALNPVNKSFVDLPAKLSETADATFVVSPTAVTRKIAGVDATRYSVSGSYTPPGHGPVRYTETMSGELWFSKNVKLPSTAVLEPVADQLSGMSGPISAAIAASLSRLGLVPLQSTITVTAKAPGRLPLEVVTAATTVTVSTAHLDDSLFAIPRGIPAGCGAAENHRLCRPRQEWWTWRSRLEPLPGAPGSPAR